MPKFHFLRDDGTVSDIGSYRTQPTNRDGGSWVSGLPVGKTEHTPKNPQTAISELFEALPSASRTKLRPFITEGFVALANNNTVSVGDVITAAEALGGLTAGETSFINSVKTILGVS